MKSQPNKIEEIPDYVEPLRAYRAWEFKNEQLFSLNGDCWEPGVAKVAVCKAMPIAQLMIHDNQNVKWDGNGWVSVSEHIAPDPDCTCGIYAGKNLEHLVEINYAQMGIHGEVDLWGIVMDHQLGYRAQYAYPRYFVVPPWALNPFHKAESSLRFLAKFNVDLYVAAEMHVTRDMEKILLLAKGESIFSADGVCQLTKNVQAVYTAMKERTNRTPAVDDRVHIFGKGISVIREISKDNIVVMLYNTTICTLLRKEVLWNVDNLCFECKPTSFFTRAASRQY